MYDAENLGLSHFYSDENKGSRSEIRCSVIKSLITDSIASISLWSHNVEAVFCTCIMGVRMASRSLCRKFRLISCNPFRKRIFKNITDLGRGVLF